MLGDNIRNLREINNMTQDELGSKLGLQRATISSWEIGRTEPNMGAIEKMCRIFKVSKTQLIDGTEPDYALNYYGENNDVYSEEEKLIIKAYKEADSVSRIKALALLLGKEL